MVRIIGRLLLLCLLVPAFATAQTPPETYNTTLFGKLNPQSGGGGRYSALTGYAAPDGREYALLGGFTGTHIIDVTESPVKQVAFIPGPANGWREMKTYQTYAYVVSEGGAGLQIIDLSQLPAKATLVKSDTSRFQTAHTITQQGRYLYVNGTSAAAGVNGGTIIFDLTHPTQPMEIASWNGRYVHDCTIRNDTLYAAAINNGQLDIVSLGPTRQNVELVTSIVYPGAGTHNADLTPDGSYILTTDEVGGTPKTLKVWDRRDIENISKVADYTPVPNEIIHNVHMKGAVAYISWYSAGTRIVDMSVPTEPAEIGYFDTYPGAENNYVGNWEVYPYLPSGKILASDMQTGLHVFTFNGAKRGQVHGVVRDANTGLPVPNAVIRIPLFGRTIRSDEQGRYSYAGAVDSLAYTAVGTNYRITEGFLKLTVAEGGGGAEQDILLQPLVLKSFALRVIDAVTQNPLGTFAYRTMERPGSDGVANNGPLTMAVPQDSTYHLYVGSWGYQSRYVEITNPVGEITVPLSPGYMDDAELDFGWSLESPTDQARGGRWERGVPVLTTYFNGTAVQPGEDNTPGLGDHAFITGITGSEGGVGNNDVDDGLTTLTSPVMGLQGYTNPIITCDIWYSRDQRTDAINDTLEVQISADGGATWQVMERITASPDMWTPKRYRLRNYFVAGTNRTMFRVIASDLDPQSLVEAGLDNFAVTDSGKPLFAVPFDAASRVVTGARVAPNPMASASVLELTMAEAQAAARVELFDATGRRAVLLHEGRLEAGTRRFPIDGAALASGRYTWRLVLDDGSSVSGALSVVR